MLIEFSVGNYLSFREKQTFSMVAAPRLQKKGNTFKPVVTGEKLPELLKVAAIYGPNASGKSNLLRAMNVVSVLLRINPSANLGPLPIKPFRFDKALISKPSTFEVNFVHKSLRYQFEFAATRERIIEERLTSFPKGKETLLYERTHSQNGESYVFGETLEGGENLHQAWRQLTGPKTLFLAQAVANSSEDLKQLKIPHEWLLDGLSVVTEGMAGLATVSQNLMQRSPDPFVKMISEFLRGLDVPVTTMRFETPKNALSEISNDAQLVKTFSDQIKTTLTHQTALGEADFDFEEESEGTKGLIGFWLPWGLMTADESQFCALVVDELDSSLHPEIVTNLIKRHLQSMVPAQLIFSTHDTHLMDAKLLRRDQFWITERDINGATQLRSIHEFEGRESEDLEKRYFEGRYRGLPILRKA